MRMNERGALGRGIYSRAQAARLIDMPPSSLARAVQGHRYAQRGREARSGPAFVSDYAEHVTGEGSEALYRVAALSFADLIELRLYQAFRRFGVSGHEVRRAALAARERFDVRHPFSSRRFQTDGRRVFAEIGTDSHDKVVADIVRGQVVLEEIMAPFLRDVMWQRGHPIRWTPADSGGVVVLDPERSFGAPVLVPSGVPTAVIARAVASWSDEAAVAAAYSIDVSTVRVAVQYERSLVARHAA